MSPRSTLRVAGLALIASLAPLAASTCTASPTYSFTDLGVASGGRLIFDADGAVNPTPIDTWTREKDGSYSIGYWYTGNHNVPIQYTAVLDGHRTVPIETFDGYTAFAFSLNQSGTYVGSSLRTNLYGSPPGTAFTFTQDGGIRVLPLPYPSALSAAYGINEAGLIVGSVSPLGSPSDKAFLSDGTTSWDLNTLIGPGGEFLLTSASDINDLGQIVGRAFDLRDGTDHFFLLTPTATPEPASILMLAFGISAYGLRRWASRKTG